MTACSQDNELIGEAENSALAKVEMTYEQYLKGYTPEEVMALKDEKTPTTTPETVADDELMKLLQDSLASTYSKTRVRTRAIGELLPYMGVFKVKTCGSYPELQVFMDCEDGGDWARVEGVNGFTSVDKNFPFSYVDGNRNIWMTFCLVMADQTYMVPRGYSALYFVGGNASLITENAKKLVVYDGFVDPNDNKNMPHVDFWERYHDNEDDNNKNKIVYKGITANQANMLRDMYQDFTPRPTFVGEKNTMLTWMTAIYDPIKEFHPGFSYGVLTGRGYNPDIEIHIDDENGKNTNSFNKVQWSRSGTGYYRTKIGNGSYGNMNISENTVYKVKIIM